MSGPLAILNRIRERVVAGDWRNHIVYGEGTTDPFHDKSPGCIIQLCSQEGLESCDRISLYNALPDDMGMIEFNDDPRCMVKDVIALLDRAITLATSGQ